MVIFPFLAARVMSSYRFLLLKFLGSVSQSETGAPRVQPADMIMLVKYSDKNSKSTDIAKVNICNKILCQKNEIYTYVGWMDDIFYFWIKNCNIIFTK